VGLVHAWVGQIVTFFAYRLADGRKSARLVDSSDSSDFVGRRCRANFVNLVEKKWPGEVKRNCSGILEVFTDIYELISSRIGLCNFLGDF